ncbi:MAG: DUF1559 domain-containing protein [Acidobacteria bacterium]|nr:DUF1559 domain-containing protein [Acidobacteriota bacterium]
MKLVTFPKIIMCLALLSCWEFCRTSAHAQSFLGGVYVATSDVNGAYTVHTLEGDYKAGFQIEARVLLPYGVANGYLNLIPKDRASGHPGGVNVLMSDGSVRFARDGKIEQVLLWGRTTEADPLPVLLVIANQDDGGDGRLVYTLIGSHLHATWEAKGRIELLPR